MTSVFASHQAKVWPYQYDGTLTVRNLAGGTPSDPKVAEGWLRTKLTDNREELVQAAVAETMVARNVTMEEATEIVNTLKHTNGFKIAQATDDPEHAGQLYLDGRVLKAAIKEAVSVAVASGNLPLRGWGETKKFALGFVAEHIMVTDDRLYLYRGDEPITEPDILVQSFPKNARTGQTGIQYTEVLRTAQFDFRVICDYADFEEKGLWPTIWLTGEQEGIGASRSQGYGRYEVTRWDRVKK